MLKKVSRLQGIIDHRQDLTVTIKASGQFTARSGILVAGALKKTGGTKKGSGFVILS